MKLALAISLACLLIIVAVSTALVGLRVTLWGIVILHVGSALIILALYEWELYSRNKATRQKRGEAEKTSAPTEDKLPDDTARHRSVRSSQR